MNFLLLTDISHYCIFRVKFLTEWVIKQKDKSETERNWNDDDGGHLNITSNAVSPTRSYIIH